MSLSVLAGAGGLTSIGVGAGDIATLLTLGQRLGNWFTAPKGDADFLAMLEEDEASILTRRGTIDMGHFKQRWCKSIRLLANGVPQRSEGKAVEKLIEVSSKFTVSMMCIVAALDEFATASTVQNICKLLLRRLIPSTEVMEDLLISQIRVRISAWRSAGTVREMHTKCRNVHQDLLNQELIVGGFIREDEAFEIADFLYWLLAGDAEVRHTSSSDVAGIAYCLVHLSFEILSLSGFGAVVERDTVCRLVYSKAPLFSGRGISNPDYRKTVQRELSTTVSLTQPDETFSTFPIERRVANRCRVAWQEGIKAAKDIELQPEEVQTRLRPDMLFHLKDISPRGEDVPRVEAKLSRIAELFAFHTTTTLCAGLSVTLGRELDETLEEVVAVTETSTIDSAAMVQQKLTDLIIEEAFTVCQAFFMGYYYGVFLKAVDTSTLEVKAVSGAWGYRSVEFLRKMREFNSTGYRHRIGSVHRNDAMSAESYFIQRSDVLSIMANLFANVEIDIATGRLTSPAGERDLCIGFVGKRIILVSSLIKPCESVKDIGRFVLLDTDAGNIPRDSSGLVLTGIPHGLRSWDDHPPPVIDDIQLRGIDEDFTRHIEPDWDGNPERTLLCIRYKGRRIASLNPGLADIMFCESWMEPASAPVPQPFGPAHECTLDDFVHSSVLIDSGRGPEMPVVVQSKGCPTMHYAAVAWYSTYCTVELVNGCLHDAFKHGSDRMARAPLGGKCVVLVA